MKWRTLWIAAVAFLVIYGGLFYNVYPTWRRNEQLAHNGLPTIGIVTEKHPMNHESITYAYRVGTTSFTGVGPSGVGGVPPFDRVKIGDQITVRYLPANPSTSLPGDPVDLFRSWSGLLFLLLPLVCLGLSIAVGLSFRRAILSARTEQ
jgi:hypothetical protein